MEEEGPPNGSERFPELANSSDHTSRLAASRPPLCLEGSEVREVVMCLSQSTLYLMLGGAAGLGRLDKSRFQPDVCLRGKIV